MPGIGADEELNIINSPWARLFIRQAADDDSENTTLHTQSMHCCGHGGRKFFGCIFAVFGQTCGQITVGGLGRCNFCLQHSATLFSVTDCIVFDSEPVAERR